MDTKVIIDELSKIEGVAGISILNKDGTVVDSKDVLETDNALMAFAGTAVNDAATKFTMGRAKQSLIKGPGYCILIIVGQEQYFGVIMNEDADIEGIEQKIETFVSA